MVEMAALEEREFLTREKESTTPSKREDAL